MANRKFLNLLLLVSMVASLLLAGGSPVTAQNSNAPAGDSPTIQQIQALQGPQPPNNVKDECKGKMRCITQADRQAARANAAPQKTGVSANFAGVNPATAALSPLGPVQGPQAAAATVPATMAAPFSTPDYFGVPNWANSPLPTVTGAGATATATVVGGVVTALTIPPGGGGSGYTAGAAVTISPPACTPNPSTTCLTAMASATVVGGVVTGIALAGPNNGGLGYTTDPFVTITGPINLATGMRKFVDTLPGLCPVSGSNDLGQCIPVAAADTTSFPGSDFYRIRLKEYNQQMHLDLPGPYNAAGGTGTNLRGYVQVDASGVPVPVKDLSGNPVLAPNGQPVAPQQYLGPLILATKDRPVRVLFQNSLTTDLQIPTDNTYMGAGTVTDDSGNTKMASQKRADLHLHGGNTPWISDGTPHQWITPAGGDNQPNALGFKKGVSFANVPDMLSSLKPLVPGLPASADPLATLNDGLGTYLWTNEQSGRLMFYHDHAYGITRLNVYAGEAAGYLLVDPAQESQLKTATVPGTIVTNPATGAIVSHDLAHLVPLVIQDKSFVPDDGAAAGQLAATDPTWPSPANCTGGICPKGFNNGLGLGKGSLWFPHVYMPNQNPYDNTGANPFGRWDYGPWFWPVFPTAIAPVSCSSVAYPGATLTCPATPNPSGTPEGFMDTPVINGTAYPKTTVAPSAYRFQMLSAGNDRSWNLGLYYAVDKNGVVCKAGGAAFDAPSCTEMSMVPAVPHTPTSALPLCAAATATAGGGLAAAALDGSGNPINGTGLPAGCWPTTWPTDGRDGGVPNPATAGPPIIVIGSEGGLLPKLAVIPSTPMGYEYNRRSITVLNIFSHGLLLGTAERADAVVDFTGVPAGSVLIFYNDGPAPVPAFDPRADYYTGGPDQSDSGGAPSTQPGYGPNTRTLMQITVAGSNPNTTAFSLSTLSTALPGIFAATQDKIIVPESAYPAANGGGTDTYARISDTSMTFWNGGPVGGLHLTNGGAGYTSVPTVSITGGGGSGTTATATLSPAAVGSVNLSNTGGFGYTSPPAVSFSGGGGTSAAATATLGNAGVRIIVVNNGGSGYTTAPTVQITAPPVGGTQAAATATVQTNGQRRVTAINVTNPGSGYLVPPAITFSGGGGTGAAATASLGQRVVSFTVTTGGSGYASAPTVTVVAPPGTNCGPTSICIQATATSALATRVVANVTLTNGGTGYTSAPTVSITGGGGSGATAVATVPTTPLLPKTIQELFTADYGRMNATLGVEVPATTATIQTTIPYGYIDPPTEIFKDGETQLWKITHNGVDSHFIHFHLFTVQVINRVGWDGAIKPPDPTEMSWKDTVRMNPLEDIVVALRPMRQIDKLGITNTAGQPFVLPNSVRPLDVTMPTNSTVGFLNVDPINEPAPVTNDKTNFGWEYVWHCHILGHEENDMMRAMALVVPPNAPPSGLTAVKTGSGNNQVATLRFTDQSVNETAWIVQSSSDNGATWTLATTVQSTTGPQTGGVVSFTVVQPRKTSYLYRVLATNVVGYTRAYAAPAVGYPHTSADSGPSNTSAAVVTN